MWAETRETPKDILSKQEANAVATIVQTMKSKSKEIQPYIDNTLHDMSQKLEQEKNSYYLDTILTTVSTFTDRPKKIPYGMWPGKLVCDTFVKKVLAQIETDPKNKNLIKTSVYGANNMFKKIQPTKTLQFWGNKLVGTMPKIWSLLFFVDNKNCGHVWFLSWIANDRPIIADANGKWVTKRRLWAKEASKIYYAENYREKFLNQT